MRWEPLEGGRRDEEKKHRRLAAAYAAALAAWLLLGCAGLARGAWYGAKGLRPHAELGWQDLESRRHPGL